MTKEWGSKQYFGLGYEFDPQWMLDNEQKELQAKLIQLCRTFRKCALRADDEYEFPRENIDALATLNLFSMMVPKHLGGLGQNHRCAIMVTETIARYGCPSTALIFALHTDSVMSILFRHHKSPVIQDLLRRLNTEKLLGGMSITDPATGGHFWHNLSSKAQLLDDGSYHLLKYGSWCTSSGFADWYTVTVPSPGQNDYSKTTLFIMYKDQVRGFPDDWKAMGMRGNMSGAIVCEGNIKPDHIVGGIDDFENIVQEIAYPMFLTLTPAVWCGIAMASIDYAKKHLTNKRHADVGMRLCDYPIIQDYVGEAIASANTCRVNLYSLCDAYDKATNNCDWSIHEDRDARFRAPFIFWVWQLRFETAKMSYFVPDKMLQACGGDGYKKHLGLERLVRDSKALWAQAPSNEVLKQFLGKVALLGENSIDLWCKKSDPRHLQAELRKLNLEQKSQLVEELQSEIELEQQDKKDENDYRGSNFYNPLNTCPPTLLTDSAEKMALLVNKYQSLPLVHRRELGPGIVELRLAFPENVTKLGCFPGQFVQIQIPYGGRMIERFLSPVSSTKETGYIDILLKLQSQGEFSEAVNSLEQGKDTLDIRGPCGGFEYVPNKLSNLSFVTSGVGAAPAIQIIRCLMADPSDRTKITWLHYSETEEEFAYKDELEEYAAKDARFTMLVTLGTPSLASKYNDGYIDFEMITSTLPDPTVNYQKIVMCGGTPMIITSLELLKYAGYKSETVYVYGAFGDKFVQALFGANSKLSNHKSE